MNNHRYGYFLLTQLIFSINSVMATSIEPTYDWTGFYIGTKAGAVFSRFNTPTTTQAGPLLNSTQASSVNNAGKQSLNTNGFLGGIELGYNWQYKPFLFGFDTSFQSLSLNNLTNSGAIIDPINANDQFVITSYANNNWLFVAKPKLGIHHNQWSFFATGGLGLSLLKGDFLFSNSLGSLESKRANQWQAGYVVGAGIETGITSHLNLKTEYLYGNFNKVTAHSMNNYKTPTGQAFVNTVNLKENIITLGMNYHFNQNSLTIFNNSDLFNVANWEQEIGARFFVSSGTAGAPQPLLNTSNIGNTLASRLTFSSLTSISEEIFARIDHQSGLFVKGYLGSGSVLNGSLNDEDFPAAYAYSNTLSSAIGNLSYATIDTGYSFLKQSSAKVGAFAGYNYYAQNINIYGCKQLAGDIICVPPSNLANFIALSEYDTFNSLRLGLSSQLPISKPLTLTSEAAYIPVVVFDGLDMHNARQLVGPEHSSHGDGAMLETILNYQLNDTWSAGLGGRYWMWNMQKGSIIFDFLGDPQTIVEPARFNTNRYGGFLQLNYKHANQNNFDTKETMNWNGLFLGGDLGGAFGTSNWNDPFNASIASPGYINVPYFGDTISSSGPLGGGHIQYNWQTDRFVYGIGGSFNATNIQGENTLFSGLGGVNGQTKISYLGTIIGKIGATYNNSLLYVNTGPAVLNIQSQINANTGDLTLGKETQIDSNWGWTGGVGMEYAFDNHWTSNVEYEYVGLTKQNVKFADIAIINSSPIKANQSLNIFKLGVNYKII